ncbi:MAG TPA: c-type cytochrome [Capsulimonadaceae bacterium]|jgi:mono/diheme cytochrome c family protein
MADTSKETHVEKKTTEIDEVQSFGGGDMKSVEPVAEVHEEFHHYSGGQIVEHASTTVSPWLWAFWGIVIVVIIGTVIAAGGVPGLRLGQTQYAYNPERTATGYEQVQQEMSQVITTTPATQQTYFTMSSLNSAIGGGQSLTGNIASGEQLYQHYCIGCHGPNQDGAGPNAVNLNPAPRNLRNAPFMQAMSLQRVETSLHKGVPGTAMPRWENSLTDTQINQIIIYVMSLSSPVDDKGNFVDPLSGAGSSSASPSGPTGGPSNDKIHAAPPSMSNSRVAPVTPTFKAGAGQPTVGSSPSALTAPQAPSGQVGTPPPAPADPKL